MDTTLLKMVISTLNTVEVKGKSNLDALLGCINALENVVQIIEAPPAPHMHEKEETEDARKSAPVTKVNGAKPAIENIDAEVADDA